MQLILIIRNNSYIQPFTINKDSTVACTFSDALENHPLLLGQRREKRRKKAARRYP